ncbi:MAG: ABC transporter substrate-binding protein [Clostridiales bacterium]|nr:ABC transporter substrate-binding protein [Clostridiales bacterium]
MNGIVLELQQELLSKDCDILNALRKAHIIATKLKLSEFDSWIQQELNGYSRESDAPDYRRVRGVLRAFNPYVGWIPAMIDNSSLEETICLRKLIDPISSLMDLYDNSNDIQLEYTGSILAELHKLFDAPIKMRYVLFVGSHCIKEIIEHIKDSLLQWTLKLEENEIVGADLSFTTQEKEKAQSLPQTINNYYGPTNVIAASTSNTQIAVGNNNTVTFDYGNGKNAVVEIKKSIEQEIKTKEDKDEALELLKEVNSKIAKKKKPSIIKSAFVALKDFLISVGAGITVALIEAKMNGLF